MACEELRRDGAEVEFHQLDIMDPVSVRDLATHLEASKLDVGVLVNNAGIAFKGSVFGEEEARITLETNLWGTMDVCDTLLPFIRRSGGRIVNVCSQAGRLGQVTASLQSRFTDPSLTRDDLRVLTNEFLDTIHRDDIAASGWPRSMYGVSKLCEIAYTKLLAYQEAKHGIIVTACCPGYCKTDMSSNRGHRSAAVGAETPVWLATSPDGCISSGEFYFDKVPIKW